MKTRLFIIFVLARFSPAFALVINIPSDYSTIQQGIDQCSAGDTVLVQPGTYVENIDFDGKNITVASLFLTTGDISNISSTVIDGNSSGVVVLFENGEGNSAVLAGFTVTGGNGPFGGGISCASGSNPTIIYNIIQQNSTSQGGGGISCWQNCDPLIANNIIYDNSAQSFGGGILCSTNSNPEIINNVISGNVSSSQGGAIMSWQSMPVVKNTICWENDGAGSDDEISGTATVSYSDIAGGWGGQGNIDQDPLFRDQLNGDFHLLTLDCGDNSNSPCIDMGDPDVSDALLDCSWGLGDTRSDVGAFGGGDIVMTGVLNDQINLPQRISSLRNYPNPFNASTTIEFTISEFQNVRLAIFDLLGRQIRNSILGPMQSGSHSVKLDASDLSSGVYFYRLRAGEIVEKRRMVLLK